MLLIHCPYCGPRSELEFRYAGEAHVVRAETPSEVGTDDWTDFLYHRSNPRGLHAERWRHIHGCARFFNAVRDTRDDSFKATYKVGEARPQLEGPAVEAQAPALSGDNLGTWATESER
jgi:sarcosine oxidase, subunit delta